jgi:hypothetical protein
MAKDIFADDEVDRRPEESPEEEEPELQAQEPQVVEGPPAPLPVVSVLPAINYLEKFKHEFKLLLAKAQAVVTVKTPGERKEAGEIGVALRKFRLFVKRHEDYYKRPLLDCVAEIRAKAQEYEEPAEMLERKLARVIKAYDDQVMETERRAREAAIAKEQAELQEKLKAEAATAKAAGVDYVPVTEALPVAETIPEKTRVSGGTVGKKKIVVIEIEDLDKVDPQYIIRSLDEKRVIEDFKAGQLNFPGLKVRWDYETRFR